MRFNDYAGTEQFRPLTAWAYFGYGILFLIPIIGWLFLIIFSFSSRNYNRRSFARSYWCGLILTFIVIAVFMAAGVGGGMVTDFLNQKASKEVQPITTTAGTEEPSMSTHTATEKAKASVKPNAVTNKSELSVTPEFKQTMDDYEAFFDAYAAFVVQYDETSTTQLLKYTQLITQYAEKMTAMDDIDKALLSKADYDYYLEVTVRIMQKLSKIKP